MRQLLFTQGESLAFFISLEYDIIEQINRSEILMAEIEIKKYTSSIPPLDISGDLNKYIANVAQELQRNMERGILGGAPISTASTGLKPSWGASDFHKALRRIEWELEQAIRYFCYVHPDTLDETLAMITAEGMTWDKRGNHYLIFGKHGPIAKLFTWEFAPVGELWMIDRSKFNLGWRHGV